MSQAARQILLGISVLLPTVAMPADLDEITIQVIDLDAERPESVTRQIELPADSDVETGVNIIAPAVNGNGGGSDGRTRDLPAPARDLQLPDAAPSRAPDSAPPPERERPGREPPGPPAHADIPRPAESPGRPDAAGRPELPGRPDTAGRPELPGRPDTAGRPETPGRPDTAGRPESVGRPDIPAPPERGAGRPDVSDHATGRERAREVGGAARAREKGQGRP